MRPLGVWLCAAVVGVSLLAATGNQCRVRADESSPPSEHHDPEHHRDHDDKPAHGPRRHRAEQNEHGHRHRSRELDGHEHGSVHPHEGDLHPPHAEHRHGPVPREGVRDAVNGELLDVARALRSIDQSYGYRGMVGCGSYTAGSAFMDWHAKGLCPPPAGRRVLPPPPLVLGGCRSCRERCGCGHQARRVCGGCGQVTSRMSACGCGEQRHESVILIPGHHDDVDWSITEEVGCTILDRRICTGCGQVYPANEPPKCHCQGEHAAPAPLRLPGTAPEASATPAEPTPADEVAPPRS